MQGRAWWFNPNEYETEETVGEMTKKARVAQEGEDTTTTEMRMLRAWKMDSSGSVDT